MPKENSEPARGGKKRKQRYLPHNKSTKKKSSYPLRPGVQGFFITCDGGRELQASREAINIIDTFYEELVHGNGTNTDITKQPQKPLNKKIKFTYSDDDEDADSVETNNVGERNKKEECNNESDNVDEGDEESDEKPSLLEKANDMGLAATKTSNDLQDSVKNLDNQVKETNELTRQDNSIDSAGHKDGSDALKLSVDKLIEEELKELGDRSKRLFVSLDSGCNGVVFIQMRKRVGDPSPTDIAKHIMASVSTTKKHMSRFLLRVLPVEVSCYSSEEEISKAIAPLVARHFPLDAQDPTKFAVLYEARANTGVSRTAIIDVVAKSVPTPHKVDLNNPDKTIIVEIAKTVCLIGVVEKYKDFSKYNLRQLTSSKD